MVIPRHGSIWLLLLLPTTTNAYITGALPFARKVDYLQELTNNLLESPNPLTKTQLDESHDLIDAWSKTDVETSALCVEKLLKRVIDEKNNGNDQASLDINDYNCLLVGWSKCATGADRVEQILYAMQENKFPPPNLDSFKTCLMAWWNQKEMTAYAAVRAQRILEWMIRLYQSNENPNVLPDADCFDIVLQIWSHSKLSQAPRQAERLVYAMERLDLSPRATSFNAVLSAWFNSNDSIAAQRTTDIIGFMNQEHIFPDRTSYSILFKIYAKSKQPSKDLLDMAVRSLRKVPSELATNVFFNTVIGLYSKSKDPMKHRKTQSILDRQLSLSRTYPHLTPDVVGLTAVLNSCVGNKNAQDVAKYVYKLFRSLGIQPNHVTYATMIQCADSDQVPLIFEDAIDAGCVSDMVIHRLSQATSPKQFQRLLQGNDRLNLPLSWTEHVHDTASTHPHNNPCKKRKQTRKRAEV